MKTTIIISTIAAVCMMITFSENTINRVSQNNTNTFYSNISYMPANLIAIPEVKLASITKANISVKAKANVTEDFSYLKFDVKEYTEADELAAEINEIQSFDYLKFDVNKYEGGNVMKADETNEMPVNEFDNLKFNVNDYTATDNVETIESQLNEFDYLKFDVNKYSPTNNAEFPESVESPINEFDFLKFDVNKYSANDLGYGRDIELPVTE